MKNTLYFILSLTLLSVSCDKTNTEQPEACYTTLTTTIMAGEKMEFYNCSKNATLFHWDFGDGNTSRLREPSHSYLHQGTYEVELVAGEDVNRDGILNYLDDPDIFKTEITVNPNHLSALLTIWSTNGWTIESPDYQLAVNAAVHFYKEHPEDVTLGEPDYTLYSDDSGQIKIYDKEIDAVCFIVEKHEEKNIVDGFLIQGIFANQSEIDSWAFIENATIGSYKYLDLNGDGIINVLDKAQCESIHISLEETHNKVVYIGK